jgi:hypothetical protein
MAGRFLLALTLFSLVAPDVGLAQQQGRPDGGQRPGGGQGGQRPGGGGARPERPTTRPTPDRPTPGRPGGPQIQPPRPGRPGGGNGGPGIQPPRPGRPDRPGPNRPGPNRPGRPTPPFRPGAGRPPNFRPIQGRPFRYPHGFAYRRWTIGLLLPSLFLSSAYYYDDYAALGVGPPPHGYRWVRYGPDLLLVQKHTRRIVDVIYGAFY